MRVTSICGLAIVLASALTLCAPASAAVPDNSLIRHRDGYESTFTGSQSDAAKGNANSNRSGNGQSQVSVAQARSAAKPVYTYLPKSEHKAQMDAYKQKLEAVMAANSAVANAQDRCIESPNEFGCSVMRGTALPEAPNIREAADPAEPAAPAVPALSPEQVAYVASARIRLTPPKPMVGPPPEINEWKMAAVGYPLWLWAEGNLDPAPVSDSVLDIAVALDARLESVVFEMGDGHQVRCSSLDTRWSRSVEPGTKSPSCGYAYSKPSLPAGPYTITANAVWAIDWTVNGATGTIPFYQSASTELPVGELQVLVR